ncbi:MAG: phospholipid scramblase-related protein [Bacteroidota bacterium]
MHSILRNNTFFVKEHVGMFKASNNYDIFDPATQQQVLQCRETGLSGFTKWMRFTDYKRMTPFNIEIRTPEGEPVLSVKRGWTFWRSKVTVHDDRGMEIGLLRQRMLSLGGKFELLDPAGNLMATLKGKWTGWNFSFVKEDQEIAHVTKKWAGLGKEMFTTADNYMLVINDQVPAEHPIRVMILGAIMSIDMVLKE